MFHPKIPKTTTATTTTDDKKRKEDHYIAKAIPVDQE